MEASQEDQRASLLRGVSRCADFLFSGYVLIGRGGMHLQKNNKLVWDETAQIMLDLFDHVWHNEREVVVDHFLDITQPV